MHCEVTRLLPHASTDFQRLLKLAAQPGRFFCRTPAAGCLPSHAASLWPTISRGHVRNPPTARSSAFLQRRSLGNKSVRAARSLHCGQRRSCPLAALVWFHAAHQRWGGWSWTRPGWAPSTVRGGICFVSSPCGNAAQHPSRAGRRGRQRAGQQHVPPRRTTELSP